MNKTFGLLALTVGVAAGGCALLPNGPMAHINPNEGKWSGPVTVKVNIPAELRSVQGLRSGVKMVEIFAMTSKGQDVVQRNGSDVVATASVTGTGAAATVTLPALPADGRSFYLVINGYTSTSVPDAALMSAVATNSFNAADTSASSCSYIVAQTDSLITPVPGVGIPLSVTMYNTVAPSANLNYNGGTSTGMVYASTFSGITPPSGGLPIRWFAWDLGASLSAGAVGTTSVRLTAYRSSGTWPTSTTYTQSGTGAATVSYGCWDTASDSLTATVSSWTTDSSGKYAYFDIDITERTSGDNCTASFQAGRGTNLSVILPSFFLPTGYSLTLTDNNNPVTLPGNGTL